MTRVFHQTCTILVTQHLFILGMTDKGKSNVHLGWQTGNADIDPYGDGKAFPHVYP